MRRSLGRKLRCAVSAMVVNEDHFLNKIYHDTSAYKLTMKE